MARIVPFQCIHPAPEYAARVAALPYDVYNRKEAAEVVAKNPLSFLNIDRPETQFPPDTDMYAPQVYEKANEMLQSWLKSGVLVKEPERGYALYEQTMNGRTQTGLVACASIDDYINQVIRRHENTRPEKEEDRVRHIDACSMQTGPIFLAYRKNAVIQAVTEQVKQSAPHFDFVAEDGIRHRGWSITDPAQIAAIQEAFAGIDRIYIADGHHRAASAVRVGKKRRMEHPGYSGTEEFNYFLSVLFPDEELKILDYNRVVKDLNGWTPQELLTEAKRIFEIRPCVKDGEPLRADRQEELRAQLHGKGELLLYLEEKWYHLTIREEYRKEDPVDGLDVSILQDAFLHPVLGIGDPKVDPRIGFVGGIRGYQELERRVREDCAAAFAMYSTSIEELFAVADAGRLMPPKSTWFEPKLRSGLYLHAF